jgi:hypothetical protein
MFLENDAQRPSIAAGGIFYNVYPEQMLNNDLKIKDNN